MLDENLPTFYLRSSNDGVKHNASVLLSHLGSDALPEYALRHPDPSLPGSKNRYAVALYDSYNPAILFGEVLLIPEWTQPNLSQEQIRLNGGIPPPPQPVLPIEFTIQLYNPDHQVVVRWHAGSWSSCPYWEFEMPQQSFRQPSTSALDRTQSDPTASENTPKLGFKWKKDGKLSKDFVCSLSGKSTNPDGSKRRNREPDITIALFRQFKEITIYEPNLSRVEMEDLKGLEVVLLLGAIVIREVFSTNMREAFNMIETPRRRSSAESKPPTAAISNSSVPEPPLRRYHQQSSTNSSPPIQPPSTRPPPTDPRTQWELDAETARLRKAVEAEERERRRREHAETKRVKRMLEEEQRIAHEKQRAIDRETERLQRIYGEEQRQSLQQPNQRQPQPPFQISLQPLPQNHAVTAYPPAPIQRPHSTSSPYFATNLQPPNSNGPYMHPPQHLGSASGFLPVPSSSTLFSRPGGSAEGRPAGKPKKNFWSLGPRGVGEESGRLTKQRSTVF